jgi:mono/diheme cytochrome c family protein
MLARWLVLGTLLGTTAVVGTACDGGETDDTVVTDDTDSDTEAPIDGSEVFASNCQACHGASGGGTGAGPDLNTRVPGKSEADVKDIVRNGSGNMGGFDSDVISDAEVDALATFVVSEWGS